MSGAVRLERAPGSSRADLVIDRADKLGALTLGMLDELSTHAGVLAHDPPRVVAVRGSAERAFSVGADIGEWAALEPLDALRASERGARALQSVAALPSVTVAAVNGHCLGGGLELALACDLRIAARSARLGLPEVTLGNATGWGGLERLVALVGPGWAKELMLTGRILSAEEALERGIVTAVVDDDDLSAALEERCAALAAAAPAAVLAVKRAIDALTGTTASAGLVEALAAAVHAGTEDARRGKESFRRREPAEYIGR